MCLLRLAHSFFVPVFLAFLPCSTLCCWVDVDEVVVVVLEEEEEDPTMTGYVGLRPRNTVM